MATAFVEVTGEAQDPERLVSMKQIAALYGVHYMSVWFWKRDGKLPPPIRVGYRGLRWRLSDVRAALEKAA
jgi:predicted DNA-binding transcriptional regulator AlpA